MKNLLFLIIPLALFSCHRDKSEYENSARKLLETGQFDEAVMIANEALEHYPNDPQLYIYRGVANFELKNTEAAINDFKTSIKYDSGNYKSHYNLGNCYFQEKEYEQAIEQYLQAIRLNSKEVEIYINLGNTYFELENFEKSLQQFEFALKLDSASYLANFNAARNLIMTEDLDNAEPLLQKCTTINPDKGDAFYFLAYIYYLQGREKEEYCLLLSRSRTLGFEPTSSPLEGLCQQATYEQ